MCASNTSNNLVCASSTTPDSRGTQSTKKVQNAALWYDLVEVNSWDTSTQRILKHLTKSCTHAAFKPSLPYTSVNNSSVAQFILSCFCKRKVISPLASIYQRPMQRSIRQNKKWTCTEKGKRHSTDKKYRADVRGSNLWRSEHRLSLELQKKLMIKMKNDFFSELPDKIIHMAIELLCVLFLPFRSPLCEKRQEK